VPGSTGGRPMGKHKAKNEKDELGATSALTPVVQLLNYVQLGEGWTGGVDRVAEERKYTYCGPEGRPSPVNSHESPLSAQNAISVVQSAWAVGRIHVGTHFKKRCSERRIDMIDVGNLIRTGVIRGKPEYSGEYKTWKYRVAATVDERPLELLVALDSTEDFAASPLVILITAYEKKPSTKP